jgi:hypothetical protein
MSKVRGYLYGGVYTGGVYWGAFDGLTAPHKFKAHNQPNYIANNSSCVTADWLHKIPTVLPEKETELSDGVVQFC